MSEEKKPVGKTRTLTGAELWILRIFLAAIPVSLFLYIQDFSHLFGVTLYLPQYLSIFFICLLTGIFMLYPAHKKASRAHVAWYDWILILAAFYVFGASSINYEDMLIMTGFGPTDQAIMGLAAILLVLEAVRRILGKVLVCLAVLFILYGHFSYLIPGIFNSKGLSWARLMNFLYLDTNGLNGVPIGVAGTMVVGFLFFGVALFMAGGGEFLSNLSLALMGRQRGGAAKVAIIASALFGSLSGSASANVAVCGSLTIPLMVRTGYKPVFAGAIEAAASTGGLFLPPVMGITAFMMAEFLKIPYYQVAIAAVIPALTYYFALYLMIHFEAVRTDIKGLPKEELPNLKAVLKTGWIYVIPVAALLYFLFGLMMDPTRAALYSGFIMVLCGLINKDVRRNFHKRFANVLVDTGMQVLLVGAACATAGLVIGGIFATNLGLALSSALVDLSHGYSFILLVLAAVGAIILGMGMPISATYTMLAILVVPALDKIGMDPMAAHLFLNFFAAMSFVTPPVCIAAFVAAGIAKCNPMACGWQASRIGIAAYIVPFAFCYNPALLMQGGAPTIIFYAFCVAFGTLFISFGVSGWMLKSINPLIRFISFAGGLLLMFRQPQIFGIGFAVCVLTFAFMYFTRKKAVARTSAAAA